MKDYYYILGVDPDASQIQIKAAYRKLSLKFHPDKNDGDKFFSDRFKDITEAYEILNNTEARAKYDERRKLENVFASFSQAHKKREEKERKKEKPIIEFFTCDSAMVEPDKILAFTWQTKNAESVKLTPFGVVSASGIKKIRAKNITEEQADVRFELVASNSSGSVTKVMVLKVKPIKQQPNPNQKNENERIIPPKQKPRKNWNKSGLIAWVGSILFMTFVFKSWENENKNQEETRKTEQIFGTKHNQQEEYQSEIVEQPNISAGNSTANDPFEGQMVYVQGGTFRMGLSNGPFDARPVHNVTISDFYIGKHEVTQAEWRTVMGSDPPILFDKGCDECPVEGVSWEDIQEFLKKKNAQNPGQNYRLPTEAEWEYAARGGQKSKYYMYAGSNNIDDVAWHLENSNSKSHPVGQKKANELGLYDMSGNVWECCSDWYAKDYYVNSPSNNPQGPSSGDGRVLRGGSWGDDSYFCELFWRNSNQRRYKRNDNVGFRLAQD